MIGLDLIQLSSCTRCPLHQTRTQVVQGQGPSTATVLILGEAPGANEDETGLPFVGAAGKVLTEALTNIGVGRDEVWITNTVKCRPPKNRPPNKGEKGTCLDWFDLELKGLPNLTKIIAMGASAVDALFPKVKLADARGKDGLEYRGVSVVACYHPAYTLRDPSKRVAFFADIARAFGKDSSTQINETDIDWEQARSCRVASVDTETTYSGELIGVAVATEEGSAWLDYERTDDEYLDHDHHIYHNAKFDLEVLDRHGLLPCSIDTMSFDDTMVMAYLLRRPKLGLKDLAESELNLRVTRLEDLTGGKLDPIQVDRQLLSDYCRQDTRLTLELYKKLAPELAAQPDLQWVYDNVDIPLIPVLIDMERTGITVDVDYLTELHQEFSTELEEVKLALAYFTGSVDYEPDFNPNSTRQVGRLLFDVLGLPVQGRTGTGDPSVDKDTIELLTRTTRDPASLTALGLLSRYREVGKLDSTYVQPLASRGANDPSRRIHTRFKHTRVESGRLASEDPNLQNIPARSQLGRRVRRAFLPRRGWKLVKADQSQAELRLVACLGQDQGLIDVFKAGGDPHQDTANLLGVDRRTGKTLQFGIVYGMSDYSLAQDLHISRGQASQILAAFFEARPGVKRYIDQAQRFVIEHGYARTLFGRRCYYPGVYSGVQWMQEAAFREACNMPIQGTQSDIMRMLMRRCWDRAREMGLQAKLLLQVHDEMVWEAPPEECEVLVGMLEAEAIKITEPWSDVLVVPIPLDAKILDNWAGS